MTRVPGCSARGVRRSALRRAARRGEGMRSRDRRAASRAGRAGVRCGRENPSQDLFKTRHARGEFPDGYDRKRLSWMT